SNRQKECVQMPGRWPDQTLDQAFGLPDGSGRRPHLASVFQRNRKSPNIHTSSGVIWGMSDNLSVASSAAISTSAWRMWSQFGDIVNKTLGLMGMRQVEWLRLDRLSLRFE